jgi:uncharacterized protein (TIGR03000 family)
MPDLRHLFHRLMPILPVVLSVPTHAVAQPLFTPGAGLVSPPGFVGPGPNRGGDCGPGVGWRYFNVPSSPTTEFYDPRVGMWNWGWSGFPPAHAKFGIWRMNRYGPAVPVYTPIPPLGGCDAHKCYMTPPKVGFGLTGFGYLSASPRLATPSVSVHPESALPGPTAAGCARLEMRLPNSSAEVWVNETKTAATGAERSFESPELAAGKEYRYQVVARWTADGGPKEDRRTVVVRAGHTELVDFTK